MKKGTAIVLFHRNLRLTDNLAFREACSHEEVLPLFVWDESEQPWAPGTASRWWLHGSLEALKAELQSQGSDLLILSSDSVSDLRKIIEKIHPAAVYASRLYEPTSRQSQDLVQGAIPEGIGYESFPGSLLSEPGEVLKKDKTPYQVFTAYWNEFIKRDLAITPVPAPLKIPPLPRSAHKMFPASIANLNLRPQTRTENFCEYWTPGELTAQIVVKNFLGKHLDDYNFQRNIPSVRGTSQLSAHLHFGEISPQFVWAAVIRNYGKPAKIKDENVVQFLKELVWRESAHQILWHHPTTTHKPLRPMFAKFPWKNDRTLLRKWQQGKTGYPIVDAGMRELIQTGWMHNRVRMIVASFLVKDLLIPWQQGAAWFWENLVDADLANNSMGWQWTAGCGPDAAPFFRVFNPTLQGQKFDPDGIYIRKFVPEISRLPNRYIFAPWESPTSVLEEAGIVPGKTYPNPVVEHSEAKLMALKSYEKMKRDASRLNSLP